MGEPPFESGSGEWSFPDVWGGVGQGGEGVARGCGAGVEGPHLSFSSLISSFCVCSSSCGWGVWQCRAGARGCGPGVWGEGGGASLELQLPHQLVLRLLQLLPLVDVLRLQVADLLLRRLQLPEQLQRHRHPVTNARTNPAAWRPTSEPTPPPGDQRTNWPMSEPNRLCSLVTNTWTNRHLVTNVQIDRAA